MCVYTCTLYISAYNSVVCMYVYACVCQMHLPTAQVEVGWMRPLGPLRSTNCATTDAAAPPPFPIDDVTIIERNTRTVSPNSDGRTRDIEVSVRSGALVECL